jgi:predicted flap endonuclease-1-like 5' DNA nuclease
MPEIPAAPPAVDLAPVAARIGKLEEAVAAIKIPQPVAPDFTGIHQRLAALDTRVAAIRMPEMPAAAPAVDLAPLHTRMGKLEEALAAIKFPQPAAPDFTAVNQRLAALDTRIGAIRMPEIPAAKVVDLTPMQVRMKAIEDAIAAIRIPQPTPATDLQPVMRRIDALEARIAAIRIPAPAPVVVKAPAPAPAPVVVKAAAPAPVVRKNVRAGSRNLLKSAAYGKPDDLKIIVGVGPVLEKMMHGIGVYYFWQIGEWTREDVAYVDTQLTAFKGRIQRDDWVPQAAKLALEPTSARKPPEDEV